MYLFRDILCLPKKLTADVTQNQLVGFDGAPAGEDGKVLGYAKSKGSAGNEITIGVKGTREFLSGGAINAGDDVISNASGKPIVAPEGAVNIFGTALNSAANAGNSVEILLK
nr:DUF2190 family protein [uncultured Cohaesibacter sp.]